MRYTEFGIAISKAKAVTAETPGMVVRIAKRLARSASASMAARIAVSIALNLAFDLIETLCVMLPQRDSVRVLARFLAAVRC